MMTARSHLVAHPFLALLLCGVAAAAQACSADSTHPSLVGLGEPPSAAGHSGASFAGEGNSDLAGAAGEEEGGAAGASGASAGASGKAGGPGSMGGAAPALPPVCDPMASWSSAQSVAGLSGTGHDSLLALTADELDLAFLRDGALYVAHRPNAETAFTLGSAVNLPSGWSASHGASLSADGKRLVLVSDPDQKRLGELSRASRQAPFTGDVDTSAFAAINQDSLFSGRIYAAPVLSSGDDQLFFNSAFSDVASTVVVSTRDPQGVWSTPKVLSAGLFDGAAAARRLPSGVAADGRTLFYFNEESGSEEARWRDTSSVDSPLYDVRSLGARRAALPNSACNRLYSEANGTLVVESD